MSWLYYYPIGDRFFSLGIPAFLIFISYISICSDAKKGILSLVGDASYSIYLTHILAISAIFLIERRFLHVNSNVFLYLSMLFSALIFGIVFHLYIEKPIMKLCGAKLRTAKINKAVAADA